MLVEMSSKSSSSTVAHARRVVQQLRLEARIERIKVRPPLPLLMPRQTTPFKFSSRPSGLQSFSRTDALLQRTCQKRPAAQGHPGLRESLQGQKNLQYIVAAPSRRAPRNHSIINPDAALILMLIHCVNHWWAIINCRMSVVVSVYVLVLIVPLKTFQQVLNPTICTWTVIHRLKLGTVWCSRRPNYEGTRVIM